MPKMEPRQGLRGGYTGAIHGWPRKIMMAVACPRCHMAAGWVCMTENGKWSSTAHAARNEAYAALTGGQT